MALIVFSALYLNLFLCFALGIRELTSKENRLFYVFYPWAIVFIETVLLWFFFEQILSRISWFPAQLLLYPLALFSGLGLEFCLFYVFSPYPETKNSVFKPGSEYNCFSLAALFLTIHFASNFSQALLLSFAFSAGGLLVYFLTGAIFKRSLWEDIPLSLKGTPMLFISMGLLSLVFSASALIILKSVFG